MMKTPDGEPMLDQKTFRSLVGKIMYSVGKVSPSMAYATNELASHMSNPSLQHWKAMKKLIGFMNGPKFIDVLIIRKPKELRVVSGADAAHASAGEDRLSTMGEVHTLGGAYINSGSRKIRCITLSSTESEIHAMSTAGQQVKFMCMLLDECFLHKSEERLMAWLYNDNIGGLFLANNKQVSMRTKHIDIRALFIRELKQTGVLEVFYEKSNNLVPDLLSKNLAQEAFDRHQRSLQFGTMIAWREDVGDDRLRRLAFVQGDTSPTVSPTVSPTGARRGQTGSSAGVQQVHRTSVYGSVTNAKPCRSTANCVSNHTGCRSNSNGKKIKDARDGERTVRHTYDKDTGE